MHQAAVLRELAESFKVFRAALCVFIYTVVVCLCKPAFSGKGKAPVITPKGGGGDELMINY